MSTATFSIHTGHSGPGTTIIVQGPHAHHDSARGRVIETPSRKGHKLHVFASIMTIIAAMFKMAIGSPAH